MWAFPASRTIPRLAWPLIRARVEGKGHLPARGPLIVAANHSSFIDPWLLACFLPLPPIRYLVTARWYEGSVFWRFFFDAHGCIPAALEDPVETIARSVEALREGSIVGIFPEGRVSKDGRIQRGRAGIGWAAALTGAPVLPVALCGSFEILPRDRRWPRPGRIELRIGPPRTFPAPESASPDPGVVRDFVGDVMGDLCRLAGQPERIDTVRPRVAVDLGPSLAAWLERRRPGADGMGPVSQ